MTSRPLDIAIIRNDEAWPEDLDPLAERAVMAALEMSKVKLKGAAELSILLTNDEEQRELNQQWRGKDSSTNVLSFPQIEPFGPVRGILGDITMARETLEREARDLDKSFDEHFTHLVIHGFLHILGYDHITDAEALQMEGLETQIMASLGLGDPYAD